MDECAASLAGDIRWRPTFGTFALFEDMAQR